MDKIGRRKPLLVSMFGTGISLVLLAAMVQINHVHVSIAFSIVAILLNRIFFSVGLGTLPPVVAAEILPFSIRGRGLAAASALGEVIRIISVVSFLPISRSLHPSLIYAALACIMFAGFGGMMALLRETKGLSMDVLHIDSVPPSPP
jgi:MFS family permease